LRITVFSQEGTYEKTPVELTQLLASNQWTVWTDMTGPTEEDVQAMRDIFHFHPLAIDDTRNQMQRPKVEEYGDYLFVILNPVSSDSEKQVSFRELDVFVGKNYVVTVHRSSESVIDDVRKRVGSPIEVANVSAGYLLYVLVDIVVNSYFPILDGVGENIDELESIILAKPSRQALNNLFQLRKTLLELRRVVGPQRDMFNVLTRRDLPFVDQRLLQYYLRDVYDHLLRITDMVDTYRDALTSTVDLYMSAVSNRLNQIVNRLTVITIVIGMLGAVGGFYGMNFVHTWPPFSEPWSVLFALGLMAFMTGLFLVVFRKAGWY
jgi:magnesium transporter